jgi:hypothetical protein
MNDNEDYISEYGLSDDLHEMEDDDGGEDLPQAAREDGDYVSDLANASEVNPEDLDEGSFEPDEE